jgi:hypothetical protein
MIQRQADRYMVTSAFNMERMIESEAGNIGKLTNSGLRACTLNAAVFGEPAIELGLFANELKEAAAEALRDVPVSEELELIWSANGPMINTWSLRRYGGPLTHARNRLIYSPLVIWTIDLGMREGVQHLPPERIQDLFPPEPPQARWS